MTKKISDESIFQLFKEAVQNFDDSMKVITEFTKNVDDKLESKLKPGIINRDKEIKLTIEERFDIVKYIVLISVDDEDTFLKLAERITKQKIDKDNINKIELLNSIAKNLFEDCKFVIEFTSEFSYRLKTTRNINIIKLNAYIESFNKEKDNLIENKILLSKSIVISILNNVESTFRNIIKILVTRNPGLMNKDTSHGSFGKISFHELNEVENILEAQKIIIDDFVDNRMYGSIDDWIKFIMSNIKDVKKETFRKIFSKDDENYLKDFALIRNIIVHNNGIVNKQFLAKYSKKDYSKNDTIILTTEDVYKFIDNIYLIMLKIIFGVWFCLYEKKHDRFELFHGLGYRFLEEQRYYLSQEIFRIMMYDIDNFKMSNKLILQVNHAQTFKWLGDESEALKLLKDIDFSIAPSEYLFARSLMLEEYKESNDLLVELIEKSQIGPELTIYEICKWPLAKNYTNSSEFTDLLKKYNLNIDILQDYTSKDLVNFENISYNQINRKNSRRGIYDKRTNRNSRRNKRNRRRKRKKETNK